MSELGSVLRGLCGVSQSVDDSVHETQQQKRCREEHARRTQSAHEWTTSVMELEQGEAWAENPKEKQEKVTMPHSVAVYQDVLSSFIMVVTLR